MGNAVHSNQPLLGKLVSFAKLLRIDQGWRWGTIFHLYTAGINLIFGNNINVSLLANIPIFVLLIIFTFLIGKEIAGKRAGIFAAFLVSFYPGIYGMSRSYGVDFPLITMVTVSSYVLIAKDLTKIRYSLLLGLMVGLTLLIKGPGAYFLIGSLAYIYYQHVYKVIKNKEKDIYFGRRIFRTLLSLVLFIMATLVIFNFIWHFPPPKFLFRYIYTRFFLPLFSDRRQFYWICPYNRFDLRSIFFYLFEMMHSMSKVLFLSCAIGFLLFFKNRQRYKMIIYLWVLIPYIIFTPGINKWGRYYFPALPALALVTAIGIFQIKSIKYKITLVTLIAVLSLVQFYDLSFGVNILPQRLYKHPDYSFVAYPPQKCEDEKAITRFLKTIDKERKDPGYKCKILFVAPHGVIDYGRLEYIFQSKNQSVEFVKFFAADYNYKESDYIIVLNKKISVNHKPDLSFLIEPGYYGEFLKINYPRYFMSNAKLKEMYGVFTKFEVVDCYFTNDSFFYLCKNFKA